MLRIEGLSKTFHSTTEHAAVDNLSLEIPEKSFFTLLGPSGCGKTTTLRCIAGLEQPDAGEIFIDGMLVFSSRKRVSVPPHRRRIGMVFQSYAIWPHMTVAQNVAYPLKNLKKRQDEIEEAVRWALQLVSLGHMADRPAPLLSGGEQQRVALARALVESPTVLLLDEPLSNLDAMLREQMRVEIRDLQQKLGLTTIYVTHDQTEAFALSDAVAVMHSGRLVELGRPEDIYEAPKTAFGAEFLGAGAMLSGHIVGVESSGRVSVRTPIGDLWSRCGSAVAEGSAVQVYIRPEDLAVVTSSTPAEGRILDGHVRRLSFLGGTLEWWIETKGVSLRGRSLAHSQESCLIRERVGQPIRFCIRMSRCVVASADASVESG